MRGSVLGSGIAHVMLLVVVMLVRTPMTIVVPGPDVVQVALVDPTATIAPPTPTPPPQVEPPKAAPEVEPEDDVGVKIERQKPPPKKPEPKQEARPPAAPKAAARPTLTAAKVGPAGLSGDLSVDTGNFEFTYYLVLVRNHIAANWTPPAGLSTGGNPARAVVFFRVGRGGEVLGINLETASGFEFFDHSALRAVTVSNPLPPLPLGFPGGELGIHFGFEWESP